MNRGTPKGLDSLWKAIKGMSSSSKIHTIVARVEPSWCKTLQPSCCKGKLGVYVSTTKRSNSGFWRLIHNGIPNGLQDLSDFKPARKKKNSFRWFVSWEQHSSPLHDSAALRVPRQTKMPQQPFLPTILSVADLSTNKFWCQQSV